MAKRRGRPVGYELLKKDYNEVKEEVGKRIAEPTMIPEDERKPIRPKVKKIYDENGVELSPRTGKPKKKPRGGKPPQMYEVEPGTCSAILSNVMELHYLAKPKTEEQYIERFNWYFDWCITKGEKPTVEGFSLAMGIDISVFNCWARGESGKFKGILAKKARTIIQTFMVAAVTENKINPVVWMFYGKNYFNYSDKREIEVSANNPMELSSEKQQEILDALPDEAPSSPVEVDVDVIE